MYWRNNSPPPSSSFIIPFLRRIYKLQLCFSHTDQLGATCYHLQPVHLCLSSLHHLASSVGSEWAASSEAKQTATCIQLVRNLGIISPEFCYEWVIGHAIYRATNEWSGQKCSVLTHRQHLGETGGRELGTIYKRLTNLHTISITTHHMADIVASSVGQLQALLKT